MKRLFTTLMLALLMAACVQGRHYGNDFLASTAPPVAPASMTDSSAFWQESPYQIWARLQTLSPRELRQVADTTGSATARGWTALAALGQQAGNHDDLLIQGLIQWRDRFPDHPGNRLLPDNAVLQKLLQQAPPQHLALLLPREGISARAGGAVRNGFLNAYYDFLRERPDRHLTLSFYDTAEGKPANVLYDEAVAQGADQIVGPLTREEVHQLSAGAHLTVPALTLNYLVPRPVFSPPAALVQFGLAPEDEAIQLAAFARSRGYTRALLIAADDPWGQRVSQTLSGAFRSAGGQIIDSLFFRKRDQLADSLPRLLKVIPAPRDKETDTLLPEEHRRQDVDVIFLLAGSADARQIVPLLKFNYAGELPVLATSTVYTGTPNPTADQDLDGILFCDIPAILASKGKPAVRLTAVGHDAFLLATRLDRLKALPDFPLYGMTGRLTLGPGQRIFRHLVWMTIKNGQPQPANR